jgi:hypothetical protein
VSAEVRCWLCSGEIQPTERSKTLGDLNVPVHIGCFDRLFDTRAPRSWSESSPPRSSDERPDEQRRPPAA